MMPMYAPAKRCGVRTTLHQSAKTSGVQVGVSARTQLSSAQIGRLDRVQQQSTLARRRKDLTSGGYSHLSLSQRLTVCARCLTSLPQPTLILLFSIMVSGSLEV